MGSRMGDNKLYSPSRRIAIVSILIAMSLITFMLENLLPPLFLPGAKIGLSNIFSLFALFVLGPIDAILIVLIRVVLSSIIVGNMAMLMYSLSAGLIAMLTAILLVHLIFPRVSLIAISVLSAVVHNIIQTLVFCFVINSFNMIAYLPYLALLGILSGLIVGFITHLLIAKIPQSIYLKIIGINNASN